MKMKRVILQGGPKDGQTFWVNMDHSWIDFTDWRGRKGEDHWRIRYRIEYGEVTYFGERKSSKENWALKPQQQLPPPQLEPVSS